MAMAYPKIALQMDLEGNATLHCHVDAYGRLQACGITGEQPLGIGFGAAALTLAPMFHMRPRARDGLPVNGGEVSIPVAFRLPASPPPSFGTGQKSDEASLAIARQIVDAGRALDRNRKLRDDLLRQVDAANALGIKLGPQAAMISALRDNFPKRLEELREAMAGLYASGLTEEQLRQLLAFTTSPAGQHLAEADATRGRTDAIEQDQMRRGRIAAREAFCATRSCIGDGRSDPPPAGPDLIREPNWLDEPGLTQIKREEPVAAAALNIAGEVRLSCTIGAAGVLSDCGTAGESPRGLGFAIAARNLVGYYRLSPDQLAQAIGKKALVTIRFPPPLSEKGPPLVPPQPRSEESVDLARKLLVEQHARTKFELVWKAQVAQMETSPLPPGITAADRLAVMEAIRDGATAALDQTIVLMAADLTQRFSDEDLVAITDFWRSPVGVAWQAKAGEVAVKSRALGVEFNRLLALDAKEAFCRTQACLPDAPRLSAYPSAASSAPSTAKP